jgi:hypothetical protein
MCEIVKSETLNGPWAIPNVVVNLCPNRGKWWVQQAGRGQIVCSNHLPGTIDRFKDDLRGDVIIKRRQYSENGYTYWK